jgi:excisionase family DNA binding protein
VPVCRRHGFEVFMEPLMTTRQLAAAWCQSPRWILRMHREHGLPAYRLGGALRFRESEVEDWLHRRWDGVSPIPASGLIAGTTTCTSTQAVAALCGDETPGVA